MAAAAASLLRCLQPAPRLDCLVGGDTAAAFVRNMLAATAGSPRAVPPLPWAWLAQVSVGPTHIDTDCESVTKGHCGLGYRFTV
jgi:hypothetical protein